MFKNKVFFSPDDKPGGGSDDATTADDEVSRLRAIADKYAILKDKVESGDLVNPDEFLKTKVEAGELYTKERYAGVQRSFEELRKTADGSTEKLTDLEKQLATATSDLETTQKTLKDLQEADTVRASELETLKAGNQRAQLIFKEFPELAPFEADGLLPSADSEKLPDVLTKFKEKLAVTREKGVQAFASGGSDEPPASKKDTKPPVSDPVGSQALYKTAMEHFSKGEYDKYDEVYDKYLKALEEEAAA